MKFNENKKGSSLVLILIVMSVLMILGTAMLSLAVSSCKFRTVEQNKKTSMYASEAGLDEAYVIMGQFVKKGIEQGNMAVKKYDENFNKLIECEKEKVFKGYNSDYFEEVEPNLKLKSAKINKDRDVVFKNGYKEMEYKINKKIYNIYNPNGICSAEGYKEFLINGMGGISNSTEVNCKPDCDINKGGLTRLKNKLENNDYKIKEKLDEIHIIPEIKNQGDIANDFSDSNPIELSITSSYTHKYIPRTIRATYDIKMASYNVQYNLPTQIVKIPKNPMWSKALMVNGNMRIDGGNVTIGNETKGQAEDPNNTGIYVAGKETGKQAGININNNSSTLKVIGNVVTNRNLMLSYDGENTSTKNNVDVTGNIYARNVIIDKNTVMQGNVTSELEAKGGKICTKKIDDNIRDGSVYLMDDMEINAKKSKVAIAGSYYGVSDGSEGQRNTPDNSSSIIINTEDIGNTVDEKNNTITNTSTLAINKKVYIAGTSYIDLGANKYQTGESISIKGNYRAYTEALPYSSSNSSADLKFKDDKVSFDFLDPLTLVTKYNKSQSILGEVKAIWEKNRYITVSLTNIGKADTELKDAYSYKIIYDNRVSKIIPLGKTVKLDTVITKPDNETNPRVTIQLYKQDDTLIKSILGIMLIYSIELNAFDKREYFEEYYKQFPTKNGLNLGEGITIKDTNENISAGSIFVKNDSETTSLGSWRIDLDRKIKSKSIQLKNQLFYMGLAKDYVALASTTNIDDIDGSTLVADSEYNNIDDKIVPVVTINDNVHFSSLTAKWEEKNGEVVILDTDINSTHVLGDGASKISGNFSKADLKGIIITNGNIIISGNLNFKGIIICNGDLIFEGVGDKNITYDKAYIENFAIDNYKLFKVAFTDVGQYAQNNESNYLFAKVYNNDNNPSKIQTNNKLIERKKWELIK
ncbi:hypothetical protein [Clostridium tagluense]|uniref:hypothetical protein n=1 Tax=Clostridium tagluense TaxID=360422 RepID=UPI001C6DFA3A|nr:hypothetical protein [Clostridium tagluense]MBW9155236.1 hypothetical protein [Clostridium tagluense]WLC64668.1 hypothetical protein KTC93_17670 [Clostridium tagluense]